MWELLSSRGWIDRATAHSLGISDDALSTLVRRRQLRRLRAGLYVTMDASAAAVQRALVADGGPDAALGGRSALWWWGLGPWVGQATVLICASRRRRASPAARYVRVAHLCARCVTSSREVRVVRVERAVLDVAREPHMPRQAEALVTSAVQQGRTTPPRLVAMAEHLHVRSQRLQELLGHVVAGSRSAPEIDFIRVVRRFRLPMPARNVPLLCTDGITRYADLAYPEFGYYIEIDGRICHFAVADWERDLVRMNEISIACDLRPLRFTSRQLRDRPAEAADQVRRAIAAAVRRGA